jgi:hypothetical protein
VNGSTRAAELAALFDEAHGEALAFAEGCPDAAWAAVCQGETWSVGVVLDHIAQGYAAFDGWVRGYLEGRPVPATRATIEEANARHAVAAAAIPRGETIAALRDNAGRAAATIRGLSDEQLAISHPMEMAGGAPVSAEQLVQVLLRHSANHLGSCRQAVGGS